MLDEIHPALSIHPRDSNSYTFGSIGRHNIVIACLPAGVYGTTSAATVASNMFISFRSIRHLLMVGVGGGAPSASTDIRLGDVVVSIPTPRHFERTGTLNKPSTSLLTAVNYEHDPAGPTCEFCDREKLVSRSTRSSDRPVVHYGLVASGNQVIKHAQTRERLAAELNVLCFEMEAAGLMDNFPCLVIRGVSDYSDSHKNKAWQGYAAATAAAYAKQLLATISVPSAGTVDDPANPGAITPEEHRVSMMNALRFDQLKSRQATIKPAHAKTCKWLLEKQEYLDWLDSSRFPEHRGFLWIKGKAGSGKSTMMKFAFQQADATVNAETVVISFFFNARGEELEKSTLGMYRSLLVQLLEKVSKLQMLLDELDPKRSEEKDPWCHEILQHILRQSISLLSGRRVICFIDALDECEEEEVRAMIDSIQSLGEHAISTRVQLHVCFSSRHYPHIAIEKGLELILEDQQGHADDITRYLHSELKIGRSKQAEEIRREIHDKASGIFLWMVLVVQILNRESQRGRLHVLRKRLREIPAKFSDLFKDILTRDTVNREDLLLILQWILFARRPLKREELYFAILSADPDNLTEAWDPEDITEQDMDRFILHSSKGLAETTKSGEKTVQFIHESVRDFLLKDNGLRELWPEHQGDFEASSHDRLKKCCNNTLLSEAGNHVPQEHYTACVSSEDLSTLRDAISRKSPFLQYAVHNVPQHSEAAQSGGICQECFLGTFKFSHWKRCSSAFEMYKIRHHTESTCLLYILAKYDLSDLVQLVDPNAHDVNGDTPLHYAIRYGQEHMFTKLLTMTQIGLSAQNKANQALLQWIADNTGLLFSAIERNDELVFNRLLAPQCIDNNALNRNKKTPLIRATEGSKFPMIQSLLDLSCKEAMDGPTALAYAAPRGYENTVTPLLSTERINVDAADSLGITPLMYATHARCH
ncbi:hypothetical protein BO79DRAFT_224172 [Aspergillus costaricaensis CBS 115574]|uniref:Uncharacterized protein n=1 Tax=Aspergillus costaricaensis CBS 115574 TaxID=1448317 RepID=A0ACD1IVD8_9EURO|nr:hypothetical protein BO79DRAFT_224172 [Aspergillus costaricaensis CBS 115574]RAK93710.1 hypothetical protein BO79DRAFT_224172 [Aspergillus costaricaensis CBS 115574]